MVCFVVGGVTYEESFHIYRLNKELQGLLITPLVLGSNQFWILKDNLEWFLVGLGFTIRDPFSTKSFMLMKSQKMQKLSDDQVQVQGRLANRFSRNNCSNWCMNHTVWFSYSMIIQYDSFLPISLVCHHLRKYYSLTVPGNHMPHVTCQLMIFILQ